MSASVAALSAALPPGKRHTRLAAVRTAYRYGGWPSYSGTCRTSIGEQKEKYSTHALGLPQCAPKWAFHAASIGCSLLFPTKRPQRTTLAPICSAPLPNSNLKNARIIALSTKSIGFGGGALP